VNALRTPRCLPSLPSLPSFPPVQSDFRIGRRLPTPALLPVLALCACSLSGCFIWTSRGEGSELRTDVNGHDRRLGKLEAADDEQVLKLKNAEQSAQTKVDELEDVIDRATTVVRRNSADVTVTVAQLQDKIGELEGRIAELTFALDQVQAKQNATEAAANAARTTPAPAEVLPEDPKAHFQLAYDALKANDYERCRSLFRSYLERYPEDTRADNAQYWIGASYLVERRPASALSELRRVIQEYRKGDAVDEALLDMAEAFYRLGACDDAKRTLKALVRSQAKSPLVPKANDKLKSLRNPAPGICKD
jgi:tol-pal system protein YbgF